MKGVRVRRSTYIVLAALLMGTVGGALMRPGGALRVRWEARRGEVELARRVKAQWEEIAVGARVDRGGSYPSLVVFTNYECPYCRVGDGVVSELTEAFAQLGVIVRPVASPSKYPRSMDAAVAALCAGEQGSFLAMHRQLFASTEWRIDGNLSREAERVGIQDLDAFTLCSERPGVADQVRSNRVLAMDLGLPGTPGYVFRSGAVGAGLSMAEIRRELGF